MTKADLLKLIGAGEFGSVIPDDDETIELLCECVEAGLVRSSSARIDDFFWLTKAGQRELRALTGTLET